MAEEPVQLIPLEDEETEALFAPGKPCLVHFADATFLVEVQEATDESVRVSFHAYDFPVAGMLIDLEFHEAQGIIRYVTKVIRGPKIEGDGILLERPHLPKIIQHRATFRVRANIRAAYTVEKGRQAESCVIRDISTTGARIESRTKLDMGDKFSLNVELGGSRHTLDGEVCHVGVYPALGGGNMYICGTRFTGYSPGAGMAVTDFVWSELRHLYPSVDEESD